MISANSGYARNGVGAAVHQPIESEPTRVEVRGWIVEVVGEAVVIPQQVLSPGMMVWDLAECLAAATTLARNHQREARPHRRQQTRSRRHSPWPIAAILVRARDIAATTWHRVHHDIYDCTFQAWEEACTAVPWQQAHLTVPYAAVVRALRAGRIDPSQPLIAVNDRSTRRDVLSLYTRALNELCVMKGGSEGAA